MKFGDWVPLLSAIVAALGTFLVGKLNSSSTRESVYADHYEQLLTRIDKLTGERDNLKAQIVKLQEQIARQSKVIDELSKQIALLKKEEEQKNGTNN